MGFSVNLTKRNNPIKKGEPKTFLIALGFILLFLVPFSLYLVAETVRTYTTFNPTSGIIIDLTVDCSTRRGRRRCYNKETIEYQVDNESYKFLPKN